MYAKFLSPKVLFLAENASQTVWRPRWKEGKISGGNLSLISILDLAE